MKWVSGLPSAIRTKATEILNRKGAECTAFSFSDWVTLVESEDAEVASAALEQVGHRRDTYCSLPDLANPPMQYEIIVEDEKAKSRLNNITRYPLS